MLVLIYCKFFNEQDQHQGWARKAF